jgi:hypothetical protein
MREIEISIPKRISPEQVLRAVEAVLKRSGLRIALRGTLKTRPGSTHWHLKNGAERGTMELTWWPARRRLWFKVQSGRAAEWVDEEILRLSKATRRQLKARP